MSYTPEQIFDALAFLGHEVTRIGDQIIFDGDIPNDATIAQALKDRKMDELRGRRNLLLLESDWTQVADAPVDNLEWAGYRQALRDLPANTTDPSNPVWPTPPS